MTLGIEELDPTCKRIEFYETTGALILTFSLDIPLASVFLTMDSDGPATVSTVFAAGGFYYTDRGDGRGNFSSDHMLVVCLNLTGTPTCLLRSRSMVSVCAKSSGNHPQLPSSDTDGTSVLKCAALFNFSSALSVQSMELNISRCGSGSNTC
ncbi:hypothetical protein Aperf_G00000001450 [Anoplocephala perfoliata]